MAILIRREQGFYRRLMKLSMPIVLQNLITFSLGLIDTFMVSQLGNTEMAAVTAANVPVFLLISIVFGVQSGLGILVSQYWGKQDMKSISRSIGVASFVGAAVAAVLAAVVLSLAVELAEEPQAAREAAMQPATATATKFFIFMWCTLQILIYLPNPPEDFVNPYGMNIYTLPL